MFAKHPPAYGVVALCLDFRCLVLLCLRGSQRHLQIRSIWGQFGVTMGSLRGQFGVNMGQYSVPVACSAASDACSSPFSCCRAILPKQVDTNE